MSRTNVQNTTVNNRRTHQQSRIVYDASEQLGLIFLASQTKELKSELSSLEERISSLEHASKLEDEMEMSIAEICDEISASEKERLREDEAARILRRKELDKKLAAIRLKRKKREQKAKARAEAKKQFMDALSRRVQNAFNSLKSFWTPKRICRSIFLVVSLLVSLCFFRKHSWAIHVVIGFTGIVMASPFYRKFRQHFLKKHSNSENAVFLFTMTESCLYTLIFGYLLFCVPELTVELFI